MPISTANCEKGPKNAENGATHQKVKKKAFVQLLPKVNIVKNGKVALRLSSKKSPFSFEKKVQSGFTLKPEIASQCLKNVKDIKAA